MRIKELWRFPVKSTAGEPLDRIAVGPLGFEGDRIVTGRSRKHLCFQPVSRVPPPGLEPGTNGS